MRQFQPEPGMSDPRRISGERQPGLEICLTPGLGAGLTTLSAFDAALNDAGIANYNLIPLSSVIPAGARLRRQRPATNPDEWGHRLYVVIAQQREAEVGRQAWAGIGWIRDSSDDKGLFVEHHGGSEAEVEHQIHASLDTMRAIRSDYKFGAVESVVTGITCETGPVCALVAAVFRSEPW